MHIQKLPGNAPIPSLHDDLLLQIFMPQSCTEDMVDDFNSVKNATQVCSAWRTTLLDSSLTWSRILSIDSPTKKIPFKWLSQILIRSKESPLWIYWLGPPAICSIPTLDSIRRYEFLIQVLTDHWERVEAVSLNFHRQGIAPGLDLQNILCRSAPKLRTVHIETCRPDRSYLTYALELKETDDEEYEGRADTEVVFHDQCKAMVLFHNDAPSLRYFRANHLYLSFENKDWVGRLRTLKTYISHTEHITPRQVLQLLSALPLIEELSLTYIPKNRYYARSINGGNLPLVDLPHLKQIDIVSSPDICVVVHNRVSFSPEVSYISFDSRIDILDPSFRECTYHLYHEFKALLDTHASGCHVSLHYPMNTLSIEIYDDWIIFEHRDCSFFRYDLDSTSHGFKFTMNWSADTYSRLEASEMTICELNDDAACYHDDAILPGLGDVITLRLDVERLLIPAYGHLMLNLSGVEVLELSLVSFNQFFACQDDVDSLIFPRLQLIKIVKSSRIFHNKHLTVGRFIQFFDKYFKRRLNIGKPLFRLHLDGMEGEHAMAISHAFIEYKDLTIVW